VKSALRENRISRSTRAKASKIITDLRGSSRARQLEGANGNRIFAVWVDHMMTRSRR